MKDETSAAKNLMRTSHSYHPLYMMTSKKWLKVIKKCDSWHESRIFSGLLGINNESISGHTHRIDWIECDLLVRFVVCPNS